MRFRRPFWILLPAALLVALLLTPAVAMSQQDEAGEADDAITSGTVSALKWRGIGPAFMSGRISEIAVDPTDKNTWYVSVASGGVWKTTNAGVQWQPIFDSYGTYSVGTLAIDPRDTNVIWVGSGENNSQRSVGYGDGIYKSVDGGKTFRNMGLEESEHIARILIHPDNSDIVYVAAQGPLWRGGGDRGVYMTGDGGESWTKLLDISENTGATDLVMDPRDPNTMYTAAYQRRRHVWTLLDGGPEGGIYKTTDGGESWNQLSRGLPSGDIGRIALAISPQNPDVIYSLVDAATGRGTYVSEDAGQSWSKRSSYVAGSPQYYQELVVDPHEFDRVYSMDTFAQVTTDGGRNWEAVGEQDKHIDNHALWIDPDDPNHHLNGNDGGLYESFDRGATWRFFPNLSIAQYYKLAVGNDAPFYTVCGGTQDNATHCGPARNDSVNGGRDADWYVPVFGDGFDPAIDPTDANTIYAQWQYGGLVRYDHRTGESLDIKPRESADGPPLRWNWDSALLISPHDSNRIYYGSQILFRSDDQGNSWRAVSGDLTRNMDRNRLEIMDRVWSVDSVRKNVSTSLYGTLVALDESPLVEGLLYTGSDDGLIQVSEDGGETWTRYESFPGVPEMTYVNDIEASRHDPDTVYAAFNNHKMGDFAPYVAMSADRGATWTSITGDLPEKGSLYALKQDHVDPNILFAATEFGVWATVDGGTHWFELSAGLPTIAARDIEIQREMDDVVIASFGRGFYVLDDYSLLRHLGDQGDAEAYVFPTREALAYFERTPIALFERAFQGSDYFIAPNPDFGATFTYFLKESLQTAEAKRQKEEAEIAKEDGDVFYPTWDDLKAEDREPDPAIFLTVRDTDGNVVRHLRGSTSKGIHRTTWDLTVPGYAPVGAGGFGGGGTMVAPGTYTVEINRWYQGQMSQLAAPAEFEVVALRREGVDDADWARIDEFNVRAGELQRVAMGANAALQDATEQLEVIARAVRERPQVDLALAEEVLALQMRLRDVQEEFSGDPTKRSRAEAEMPGLMMRLFQALGGATSTSHGPTQTHLEQMEIAAAQLDAVLPELTAIVEQELPALHQRLEEAGVAWTPGRGVPRWRR